MPSLLKSGFLLLMAAGVLLVAIQSIYRGSVTWRGGRPAAVRESDPIAFWGFILFLLVVAIAVGTAALLA